MALSTAQHELLNMIDSVSRFLGRCLAAMKLLESAPTTRLSCSSFSIMSCFLLARKETAFDPLGSHNTCLWKPKPLSCVFVTSVVAWVYEGSGKHKAAKQRAWGARGPRRSRYLVHQGLGLKDLYGSFQKPRAQIQTKQDPQFVDTPIVGSSFIITRYLGVLIPRHAAGVSRGPETNLYPSRRLQIAQSKYDFRAQSIGHM